MPQPLTRLAAAAAGTTGDAVLPDQVTNTVANANTIANTAPPTAAEGETPTLTIALVENLINTKMGALVPLFEELKTHVT